MPHSGGPRELLDMVDDRARRAAGRLFYVDDPQERHNKGAFSTSLRRLSS
jgi:hypothetical protein